MVVLLALIILLVWGYSYFRFRQKMSFFSMMHDYLYTATKENPTQDMLLRLSGACIMIQHYKDAYEIYEEVLSKYPHHPDTDKIEINKAFCMSPVPGAHGPKNYNKSWRHNFVLVRLGRQRYNFLTQEDFNATEALMRISNK